MLRANVVRRQTTRLLFLFPFAALLYASSQVLAIGFGPFLGAAVLENRSASLDARPAMRRHCLTITNLLRPSRLLATAGMRSRRLSCSAPRWNFFHTRSNRIRGSLTGTTRRVSHDLGEPLLGAVENQCADHESPQRPRRGVDEVPWAPEKKAV